MSQKELGIVGVGLLGSAMAERCLQAGFAVYGCDVEERQRTHLTNVGGTACKSAGEVFDRCSRVLLSLPTTDVVKTILEEVAPNLRERHTIIDTTTGEPDEVAALGERLKGRGVQYIDATVSGSSDHARQGKVVIMAGGDAVVFEACRDVFDTFSQNAFHVGPCGSGTRMKLVTNLVLGLHRAVLAEGLTFAEVMGLDGNAALECLRAGIAYSRTMDTKGEKMLNGDFLPPQARLSQHLKDVRLILAAGEQCGQSLPLSELHRKLLETAETAGYGDADNSAVIRAFESLRK